MPQPSRNGQISPDAQPLEISTHEIGAQDPVEEDSDSSNDDIESPTTIPKALLNAMASNALDLSFFSPLQLRHINIVLQSHAFRNATTFREQVKLMTTELHADDCPAICTYAEIAKMFGKKMHSQLEIRFVLPRKFANPMGDLQS
jgi:hypothetical protein